MQKLKKQRGITLIALVVTIIVLLILAGITIGLVFGPNGIINKAHEANENTKIEQVREQLELAKGPEYIEGNGKYNPDSYFERIEAEGIIGNKETDVKDNEDGTYEVTTVQGYIFIITLVPSKDNVEDIEIDYGGKVDGPRIREITVTNKTTSSISVEVETANAEGATYRYYYKKEGEEEWKKAGEGKENTYTFNGLEENKVYNIKVEIEKDGKTAAEETSSMTGEMPTGAVQFSPVEWENGKASTVITTNEEGYTLQYQIGGIAEGSWINTTSGSTIGDLEYGVTVYGRLYDGTNGSNTGSIDVEDKIKPTVVIKEGTITTKSIVVNVEAVDDESGMKGTPTYTYYIKKTGEADSAYEAKATDITEASYTFTGLTQKTGYDIKVEVKEDKAGNVGIGKLLNKETGEIGGATGGLIEGNIIASSPTWSNGQASITLSTSTSLTIQYQVGGIAEENWTPGTEVTGLQHGQTVYARLTDGINYGDEASVDILDKQAPTITVTKGEVTTKSITVSVSSSDAQWGMPSTPTYSYYIKKSTDGSYPTEASYTGANTSYTFNNLSQTTNYDIQVTVQDKAENTGTGTLLNQATNTIGGATGGLIEGNIIASTPTWSNRQASITLSTSTGLTIQYQVGGIEDNNWTTGTEVTGLQHGQTVYARLTDGINYGDEASVDIIDNVAPTVNNFTVTTFDTSSITAKIDATDNQTGIAKYQFEYKLSTSSDYTVAKVIETTNTSYTYKYTGLTDGTTYNLRVIAFDKAGKQTPSSVITQTTKLANVAPSVPTVTFNSKTTNSINISAKATDNDGDNLTYKLYVSTAQNSGFTEKATSSATSETQVTLQATGLSQYTTYYYYVTVTDGKETETSTTSYQKTYCPGTGLTCNGPFSTTTTCSKCNGAGTGICNTPYKMYRKRRTNRDKATPCYACGIIMTDDMYVLDGYCPNCGRVYQYLGNNAWYHSYCCTDATASRFTCDNTSAQCSNCNGTGQVTTNISCSHGKTSTHSYCSHNRTTQHDD